MSVLFTGKSETIFYELEIDPSQLLVTMIVHSISKKVVETIGYLEIVEDEPFFSFQQSETERLLTWVAIKIGTSQKLKCRHVQELKRFTKLLKNMFEIILVTQPYTG